MGAYKTMFGTEPTVYSTPLEKNDHPEIDQSELLGEEDTTKYQSMIGALQWVISLGRFDIATAVMTMSRFRAAPREGHLKRLKHIYGYLSGRKDGAIRVRTEMPDMSEFPPQDFDWMYTVYGAVKEIVPKDIPKALGKPVTSVSYVDANLLHDFLTGRSVTGILHLLNQTPTDWFSKRQSTVETATYGSEFTAARIAVEQIMDLRITLRYFGVPINGPAYLFGDNQSVVTSSTLPHSGLNKRWNALSYHRVREAVAAKLVRFYHIKGEHNPADVLSKHVGFPEMWRSIKSLLFWQGDTTKCLTKDEYQVMKTNPHGTKDDRVQGEYQGTKTESKRNPTDSKGSSQGGSSDSGAPEKYNHDSTEKTIQTGEKKVEFANIGYPGSRDEGNEHMMASEASWYFI